MKSMNKRVLALLALLLGSAIAEGEFGVVSGEDFELLSEDELFWASWSGRDLEGSMSVAPTPKPPSPRPPSGPSPTSPPPPEPTPPSPTNPSPTEPPPTPRPPTNPPPPEPTPNPPTLEPTPIPPTPTPPEPTEAPPTESPPTDAPPVSPPTPRPPSDIGGNLAEVLAADDRFTTLVSLVDAAGLLPALEGTDRLTVFAPTNDAFAALNLPPETSPEVIEAVLLYHVIGELVDPLVDGMMYTTLNGAAVTTTVTEIEFKVNDSNIVDTLPATNGIIYAIDAVLIPPMDPAPSPTPGRRRSLRAN